MPISDFLRSLPAWCESSAPVETLFLPALVQLVFLKDVLKNNPPYSIEFTFGENFFPADETIACLRTLRKNVNLLLVFVG